MKYMNEKLTEISEEVKVEEIEAVMYNRVSLYIWIKGKRTTPMIFLLKEV